MKHSTATITESKTITESETCLASHTYNIEEAKNLEKAQFEKECKEGMSVEKFRTAALKHVNSLPWKK